MRLYEVMGYRVEYGVVVVLTWGVMAEETVDEAVDGMLVLLLEVCVSVVEVGVEVEVGTAFGSQYK